jgi:hypothetical protein
MTAVVARGVLALGSVIAALFAVNSWLDTGQGGWDTAASGTVAGVGVAGLAALARGAGVVSGRWLAVPLAAALAAWVRPIAVAYP